MHHRPARKRLGPLARITSTTLGVGLSLGIVLALSWVGAWSARDAVAGTGVQYAGESAAVRAQPARSVTLRRPSGTSAGDVLVASFTVDSRPKITRTPRGWTPLLPERLEAGRNASLFAYYHVVGIAEAGTKSWSWRLSRRQEWSGGIARYSGVDTDHPVDTSVSVATSGSAGRTFVVPGVRTTKDGAVLIGSIGASGRISATPPTGWSEAWDIARGEAAVHAHGPEVAAGKTADVTWKVSTGRSVAGWTTALRPDKHTSSTPTVPPTPTPTPTTPASTPAVLLGAGDIASCAYSQDSATGTIVAATPGTVFTLGDNAYDNGTATEFATCYDAAWGAVKGRTRPVVGNHEYQASSTAASYFAYFGAAAGPAGKGWYSYDIGTDWHVVVLNSNCTIVGCAAGSEQEQWLRADLLASTRPCTVAMWHHPRFSSGEHGSDASTAAFWTDLYADGAELVLNGHDHDYERFAPQNPAAVPDPSYGIRELVVGTGGQDFRPFRSTAAANSEVRSIAAHGVLKLNLNSGGYDWSFLPIPGESLSESGSGACHGPPPA